jgi:4-hydroxythreonine-4-phosphate dehydrogenase
MRRLLLTTGDVDGIGFEVTAKALLMKALPDKNNQVIYFSSIKSEKKYLLALRKKFKPLLVSSLDQALLSTNSKTPFIEVQSELSPAQWVKLAALAAISKKISAIVTAPLSKQEIHRAGFKEVGHTEIFKTLSGAEQLHMGFVGKYFNVVLATGHIPLEDVSKSLNESILRSALEKCLQLRKVLKDKRPIGVLGLNPHSGDGGIIGNWETKFLGPFLKSWAKKDVFGPLVPDAAFISQSQKKYSVFLALYHDQGLIPFKAVHGYDSGVHLSLGLPFVRTSVDHGTAKDIFGKGTASAASMRLAIETAIKLT